MLVFVEPPCFSVMLSILLKSPARIHCASGNGICAKCAHNMAREPVWLKPYIFVIPNCKLGWCWGQYTELYRNIICRDEWLLWPSYLWALFLVPPLKCPDWAKNEALFQRLEPPLISMIRTCLRHASSGSLTSWRSKTSVIGVVFWYRVLISFIFLLPKKPLSRHLVLWVEMVISFVGVVVMWWCSPLRIRPSTGFDEQLRPLGLGDVWVAPGYVLTCASLIGPPQLPLCHSRCGAALGCWSCQVICSNYGRVLSWV